MLIDGDRAVMVSGRRLKIHFYVFGTGCWKSTCMFSGRAVETMGVKIAFIVGSKEKKIPGVVENKYEKTNSQGFGTVG